MQKARGHPCGLPLLVGIQFQKLFHPPIRGAFHLSLTVLVRYRSQCLFSLGGWAPQLQTGLLVSDPTQEIPTSTNIFRLRDFHALWCDFPDTFGYTNVPDIGLLQPRKMRFGLLSLFARRY